MNPSCYPTLSRAQLSYDYLHTNSTTHEFLFGAIVELVDNARDAEAQNMKIFTMKNKELRGEHMLCFLDDGCGMDRQEAAGVITFGYSTKRLNPNMIGQYGNGLKSGAMRIGQDFILFTKKHGVYTCVFLSRTFHEQEKIEEVIVPMPSFDLGKKPIIGSNVTDNQERQKTELDLILKYSPFKTMKEFLSQFENIEGDSGTLVIIYNLKLLDNGESELDFLTDPLDVQLSDPDKDLVTEKISLRAYLAIVYSEPKMKIYIQDKKVRTRRVVNCLYKPKCFKFSSARFKARAEKDADIAKDLASKANERAKEAEGNLKDFERRNGSTYQTDKSLRAEHRQLQDLVQELKAEAKYQRDIADEKCKHLREPKMLNFIFGVNLERRNHDGVFVYNNGRLIKMYQKVGPQLEGGVKCSGVVGVVDIPYLVLEPTHNKQDFADAREYRQLLKAMGEHMEQYWQDTDLGQQDGGVSSFWASYGYLSSSWNDAPSDEERFVKKRLMQSNITLQCDKCLKWRIIPFQSGFVKSKFPDNWICLNNPDNSANRCEAAEKKLHIPECFLTKRVVSVDKRKEALAKRIEKQQAELNKLQKVSTVKSRKDVLEARRRAEEKEQAQKEAERERKRRLIVASKKVAPKNAKARGRMPVPQKKQRVQQQESSEEEESESEESEEEAEPPPKKRPGPGNKQRPPVPPSSMPSSKRPTASSSTGTARRTSNSIPSRKAASPPPRASVVGATASSSTTSPGAASSSKGSAGASSSGSQASSANFARRSAPLPPSPTRVQKAPANTSGASVNGSVSDDTQKQVSSTSSGGSRVKRTSVAEEESSNARSGNKLAKAVADEGPQIPTSSTEPAVSSTQHSETNDKERIDELTQKFRRCLYYFLPPKWRLSKAEISQLSADDLLQLDLPEFFQAYEQGLKMLVAEHQRATDEAQKSHEETQEKLCSVRRMVASLLKSINQEFEIDPQCDSDQVDQLLEACVQQAQQESGLSNGDAAH